MDTGIVLFAFGMPNSIQSNRQIAKVGLKIAVELDAPIYTQLDALSVEGNPRVEKTCYIAEIPGNPPPTLRIARGAVRWARRKGLTKLWVVAARPHLPRILRDMGWAIHEAGEKMSILVPNEIRQYPEDSWFCANSTQTHTQSRAMWVLRDSILRFMPFALYRRIAS